MKLVLMSDIHANLEALRAALAAVRAEGADAVYVLGDIVGYNTDPEPCIDLLVQAGARCIAGNHDRAVTGQIGLTGFSPEAARGVRWTRRHLSPQAMAWLSALPETLSLDGALVVVHGALHPETGRESVRLNDDAGRLLSARALAAHPSRAMVCGYGHTHRAALHALEGGRMVQLDPHRAHLVPGSLYLANPGAVGQPRDADRRAGYMVMDTARRTLDLRRVDYDWQAARAKTLRAGLVVQPLPLPPLVKRAVGALPVPVQGYLRGWVHRLRG